MVLLAFTVTDVHTIRDYTMNVSRRLVPQWKLQVHHRTRASNDSDQILLLIFRAPKTQLIVLMIVCCTPKRKCSLSRHEVSLFNFDVFQMGMQLKILTLFRISNRKQH